MGVAAFYWFHFLLVSSCFVLFCFVFLNCCVRVQVQADSDDEYEENEEEAEKRESDLRAERKRLREMKEKVNSHTHTDRERERDIVRDRERKSGRERERKRDNGRDREREREEEHSREPRRRGEDTFVSELKVLLQKIARLEVGGAHNDEKAQREKQGLFQEEEEEEEEGENAFLAKELDHALSLSGVVASSEKETAAKTTKTTALSSIQEVFKEETAAFLPPRR